MFSSGGVASGLGILFVVPVGAMALLADIRGFVENWLPCFIRDHRAYLTVAIGCTGGQHRSVYFAETLAAAGANFGVPATLPQMAGVAVGLASVTAAVGLGLGVLYTAYPQVSHVLKIAGILYILYLAWRIATTRTDPAPEDERDRAQHEDGELEDPDEVGRGR